MPETIKTSEIHFGRLTEPIFRSMIPLVTLAIIGGSIFWGPWVSLALAIVCWRSIKSLA